MEEDKTKILLDADVVINFINGEKLDLLVKIYPNRFCLLDRVKAELYKRRETKEEVEKILKTKEIEEIKFPDDDMEILFEYGSLISERLGDGESACLAFARFRKKYISSSNIKDVHNYCKQYGIKNIPTMELLREALNKKLMTIKAVNEFIKKCIEKDSKLPAKSWDEYLKTRFK